MTVLERVFCIATGVVAGIAFVVSCGDNMQPSAAEEDSGGGGRTCDGTCSVSGPIAVSNIQEPVTVTAAAPLKVVTADTDLGRLRAGIGKGQTGTWVMIASGPLVLTDLAFTSSGDTWSAVIGVKAGTDCSGVETFQSVSSASPVHGARIPVPSGSVACVYLNSGIPLAWSAFVPY